jgi:hypothetical protein
MEEIERIDKLFIELENKDGKLRYEALQNLIDMTENKVSWVYDKWFVLLDKLSSDNSYQRSIGLMLLANLAKSDDENRIGGILDKYLAFFDDDKFITSRQCIQNVWKIAICNKSNCSIILTELGKTYFENIHLKSHGNLIKEDVIFSLSKISKYLNDNSFLDKANELIDNEIDTKLIKSLKKVLTQ